jgi:tRNA 5-methylaminomethyl-2-thiouridine biosynthesis bifunctional protein
MNTAELTQQLMREWRSQHQFVVVLTDFENGHFFLNLWAAWRADTHRCAHLHVVAMMPRAASLQTLTPSELTTELINTWPPITPNLHSMRFESGQVQLLLAPGDAASWLPKLSLQAHAWVAGDRIPTEPFELKNFCKNLGRLSAPDARFFWAHSAPPSPSFLAGLHSVGFKIGPSTGENNNGFIARFAPQFKTSSMPPRAKAATVKQPRALVVGAGLAGSAAAWALAEQGWHTTVLDRQSAPAMETSGNPAGLFHGIVNAQDGRHARFNRAAALAVNVAVRHMLIDRPQAGSTQGLLRLERPDTSLAEMQKILHTLALPADYVQAISSHQASTLCGVTLASAAWFYPGGGWVRPAALVASYLKRAGPMCVFRGGVQVHSIRRATDGWQVLDALGQVIDESEVLVLANAMDALRLLGVADWPVHGVRGQLSMAKPQQPWPHMPLTGAGYAIPEVDGQLIFGATSQRHDLDPSVRQSDHVQNVAQLSGLMACVDMSAQALQGRTAWRCVADDKLPLVGAVPDVRLSVQGTNNRLEQPRMVPRQPGLYVFTGLGSRGITWSALGAQALASSITGAPSPIEGDLLDAIDPARFVSRQVRLMR